MARGFTLSSGISKMLIPVAVVGAVGFLAWYLGINPSTRVFNLFGFLAPPVSAGPIPEGVNPMAEGIPVTNTGHGGGRAPTGESGQGFQTFAGSTESSGDLSDLSDEDYDKINVSS